MQWKQVKDELPPTKTKLAIGEFVVDPEGEIEFRWYSGIVNRPYDDNVKYNPEYYEVEVFNLNMLKFETNELKKDMYWINLAESIPEL